jgi:hypothetical protein
MASCHGFLFHFEPTPCLTGHRLYNLPPLIISNPFTLPSPPLSLSPHAQNRLRPLGEAVRQA